MLAQRTKTGDKAELPYAIPNPPAKFGDAPGIESSIQIDEKKEFLEHEQQIRRVSLGDDTADSAGYGYNLLRLPVSIQPGRLTGMGYGAHLNVTVRHEFDADFTARTFRDLVVNDLVNLLTPLVYNLLTHSGWEEPLNRYESYFGDLERWQGLPQATRFELVRDLKQMANCLVPANHDLKMCYPISRSDLVSVFLVENLARIARDSRPRVMGHDHDRPTARPRVSDLRIYLRQELEAAYSLMSDPESTGTGLADLEFIDSVAKAIANRQFEGRKNQRPDDQASSSHEANAFARDVPGADDDPSREPEAADAGRPVLGDRRGGRPARPADPPRGWPGTRGRSHHRGRCDRRITIL